MKHGGAGAQVANDHRQEAGRRTDQRVLDAILELREGDDDGVRQGIEPTNVDVSRHTGIKETTVAVALRRLLGAGAITREGRSYTPTREIAHPKVER